MSRMPPCRLELSPIAATLMSRRVPGWAKGGSVAVTMTAAVFFACRAVAETVKRAASNLDAAKRQGRNRVVSDETGSVTEGTRAHA